jgi:hypothetical protein
VDLLAGLVGRDRLRHDRAVVAGVQQPELAAAGSTASSALRRPASMMVRGEDDAEDDVREPWRGGLVVVMDRAARREPLRDRLPAGVAELRRPGPRKAPAGPPAAAAGRAARR